MDNKSSHQEVSTWQIIMTEIRYIEQINAGKLTVTEAVKELGCSRSAIYSWMKKLSEDGEDGLPGSGNI